MSQAPAEPASVRPQLKLLVRLHYAYLGILFVVFLMWAGWALIAVQRVAALSALNAPEDLSPISFLPLAFVFSVTAVLFVGQLVLLPCVARSVARRQHHGFCLAADAVLCLSVPLGTILGIYSIVVLTKPATRAVFR